MRQIFGCLEVPARSILMKLSILTILWNILSWSWIRK